MKRLTHSIIAAFIIFAACDAWAVTKLFTQDAAPETCTTGDLWVDTNGTSGQRLYTCESANTWALHLGVGPTSNPSFLSLNVSGGNLAAANKQVTKAWGTGLPYTADVTSVIHGGQHYICTSNHTAGSTTEPGVGASWETVWAVASGGGGDDLGDAAYSDVVALWTTCSGYLKSDGTCDTPSGSFSWPASDGAYYAARNGAWSSLTGIYQGVDNDLTTLASPTNWRVFYSNGSGVITQLALGADGTYLKSNGASSAPSWATPSTMVYPGSGVPQSTGSAWGTSLTVGTSANNLLQLNGSGQIPAVPGTLLTDTYTGTTLSGQTTMHAAIQALGTEVDNSPQATTAGVAIMQAADYAAMRALLDLEAGTDFNAYDADLTTWAGITPGTGVGAMLAIAPGSSGGPTTTIASGTSALGTGAISSGACASAVTTTATNAATTDVINWGFNGDPTGVTGYAPTTNGMLTIIAYPSSGNVNFKVCNLTANSITPGAITLNWRVQR